MKIPAADLGIMAVAASRVAEKPPRHHRALAGGAGAGGAAQTCDAAFLRCILSPPCRTCFTSLQDNGIDWTNVVPDTPCADVLGFLVGGGHCLEVKNGGEDEKDAFCGAFDTCVVWDEETPGGGGTAGGNNNNNNGGGAKAGGNDANATDCSKLTSCDWPGIHEQFLGDGVCHENMPGCYNSPVCNYDGGDCCEDTCQYRGGSTATTETEGGDKYGKCGLEGFACRDPSSLKCEPSLARSYKEFCSKINDEGDWLADDDAFAKQKQEVIPICSSSDTLYRLVQYDSWGDGWDETLLTMKQLGADKPVYQGGLEFGSEGTVHLCLSKVPSCYRVTVENGVWGNEVSWELRPLRDGAPVIGAGGSPTDCTVPVGGVSEGCHNTCDSTRPDTKIGDPNYKDYKSMEACLELKCLIQVGNCAQDESCAGCMQGEIPEYCFANENFNVLIDCSMCSCSPSRPAYCDAKSAFDGGSSAASHEGTVKPQKAAVPAASGGTSVCTPEQTLKGTSSLIKFSECAKVDQLMAMVTDFDNDNFGSLDLFEECAHTYDEQPLHGGKSSLDCMKILHNLIEDEGDDEDKKSPFKPTKNAKGETLPENVSKAISSLAHHLYHDAEEFCDCSADTNKETPMCSSFINFKTLLAESVDACKSLDAIDCAAWEEFYAPCKKNLLQMYDAVNFDNHDQCAYVENMCGGAGPFPAFRRLDCGGEIAKPAWDFHTMYERGCLKTSPPAAKPATPATPKISPDKKPYQPGGGSDEKKPYYSSPDPEPAPDTTSSYAEKTNTHHFFRWTFVLMVLVGVGYVAHKKRRENFNYMRFRQLREARNYAGGLSSGFGASSGGEYTGVSMADSCSFEPPTLPPMPSSNTSMI